jgi:hypothetical protein
MTSTTLNLNARGGHALLKKYIQKTTETGRVTKEVIQVNLLSNANPIPTPAQIADSIRGFLRYFQCKNAANKPIDTEPTSGTIVCA